MAKSRLFKTADEAAVDALRGALPKSMREKHEYGGFIYRIGSPPKFFYMTPLLKSSQPRGGSLTVSATPPGAKLVAQMHTHPFDEDFYGEEGVLSTIVKPARFSDVDVKGRDDFEKALQSVSQGPIDMYVIDIHREVSVLERKLGSSKATERQVRPAADLTGI